MSEPASASPGRHSAADDSSYWYDLLAEDPAPEHEEARGPFEPLLPSHETTGPPDQGQPEGESHEAPDQTRARKLEQLKDLYLTAEAIGEDNVDKHFDLLLAQQRELISDYFRQSTATSPGHGAEAEPGLQQPGLQQPGHQQPGHQQADDQQPDYQQPDGPRTPPEGVSVRAEPPRAW